MDEPRYDTIILETDVLTAGWRLYFGRDARESSLEFAEGGSCFQAACDWSGDVPRIQAQIRDRRYVYPLQAGTWTLDPGQRCGPGTLMVRLRVK